MRFIKHATHSAILFRFTLLHLSFFWYIYIMVFACGDIYGTNSLWYVRKKCCPHSNRCIMQNGVRKQTRKSGHQVLLFRFCSSLFLARILMNILGGTSQIAFLFISDLLTCDFNTRYPNQFFSPANNSQIIPFQFLVTRHNFYSNANAFCSVENHNDNHHEFSVKWLTFAQSCLFLFCPRIWDVLASRASLVTALHFAAW